MKTLFFLLLALAWCCFLIQAKTDSETKLEQIQSLAKRSSSNVVVLDDSTYPYFATKSPRPYHLVVFFTTSDQRFRCDTCKILDKEYQVLASSYQRQLDLNGGHPEEGEEDLFFVKLEYGSSQQTFASYQLKSVPLMIHIPPDYGSGDASAASHELSARNTYQVPKVPSAENIEGFVRERTAINIPIHRSMVGTYILLFFAFVCLIFVASIVVNHLEFWLKVIRVKMLWVVVSLGVYTCAISGLIFDIIRSPPMYNIHPNTNQIIFFYPQQGNQFVVEGFVIGFLNVAAGLCIFLMMYLPSRIKRLYADPASGSNMASVAAVTFGALFVMIFLYIRALYTLKNRWYMR